MMGKKIFFLFFSFLTTGFLLYYVFSQPSGLSWKHLITRFNPFYAWAYLALYGAGLFLRTWRYRLLIRASSQQIKVPFGELTLVTAVRNMLVDLLPARVGGLSYPLLLNRVVGVDLSHCLSSFTYGFIFDLISLGPLLGLAVLWDSLTTAPRYPWLWALSGVILAVGLLGLLFLESITKQLTHWSQGWSNPIVTAKSAWKKNLAIQLKEINHSFYSLRKSRIFWPLLGLSLVIRVIKYSLLYLMLTAVIGALLGQKIHLPFLMIIFGLMGSEMAASLPISGLAGFGFYEGILGATMAGLGIQPAQGVSLALAMHILTQVVDYSIGTGALAFLFYLWMVRKKKIIV
ncbi:MAG: flippase-like domain-containing protein [Deltaproteobacteria bacterium]|nr:flippase-like domain-containing protein [Deltaproteobacteria bacterium]